MKLMKPSPSVPSRFSAGTSTLSNRSSRVSEARQPSLSSFLPAVKPFMLGSESSCPTPTVRQASRSTLSFVRMKLEIPLVPLLGSVTAVTTKISPTPACVMNRLLPFRMYLSPCFTAVVRVPPASLPAASSVRPKPPSTLPPASSGT